MAENPSDTGARSVPAIITYFLLGQTTLLIVLVFAIIVLGTKVEGEMIGILGGLISSITGAAGIAVGYWVGSSAGAKSANAAVAQLAGAGPPPPAAPLAPTPDPPATS